MIVLKLVAGDRNIFFPRYFSNFYTFFNDKKISRNDNYMTRNLHTLKFCSENMYKNQPYICAILQNSMLSIFLLSNCLTFAR